MNLYLPLNNRLDPICTDSRRQHELLFIYGSNKFVFVDNINDAEIIPVPADISKIELTKELLSKHQLHDVKILLLQETHIAEGDDYSAIVQTIKAYQEHYKNIFYVTLNRSLENYSHAIFTDYCFNRHKAYYTNYDQYDLTGRIFTGRATNKMFALTPIKNKDKVSKKFLIPNNIYTYSPQDFDTQRIKARQLISTLVRENDCYYSDSSTNTYLLPEEQSEIVLEIFKDREFGFSFTPIANSYYDDSLISVYGETIVESNRGVKCISEKTYEPLIKGHFILPLAYPGIIQDLKHYYGFKFPDWIDYSYDVYVDNKKRFAAFTESLNKLRNMSFEELLSLHNKDIAILEHNRNIFYTRKYDILYDRLQEKLAGLIQR